MYKRTSLNTTDDRFVLLRRTWFFSDHNWKHIKKGFVLIIKNLKILKLKCQLKSSFSWKAAKYDFHFFFAMPLQIQSKSCSCNTPAVRFCKVIAITIVSFSPFLRFVRRYACLLLQESFVMLCVFFFFTGKKNFANPQQT